MRLRNLFRFVAVVSTLFGLGSLLAPVQMAELYGVTLSASAVALVRLLGAAMLTFGWIAWLARDAAPSEARQAIVLGYFAGDILGALVALQAVLAGHVNALGWTIVIVDALVALGFGYFAFTRQPTLAR